MGSFPNVELPTAVPSPSEFQQRVITEKQSLDESAEKLFVFFTGPVFSSLPEDEQERMKRQYGIMLQYSEILGERIAAFK